MKKIGIIIFIVAVIVGCRLANFFSVGKSSAKFFNFSVNFGGEKVRAMLISETRNVSDFKEIDVGGVFEVEIVAQKDFSVEVEADDNLLAIYQNRSHAAILWKSKPNKRISSKNPFVSKFPCRTSNISIFQAQSNVIFDKFEKRKFEYSYQRRIENQI